MTHLVAIVALWISASSILVSALTVQAAARFRRRWIAYGRRYGTVRERRHYMAGRMTADDLARLEARR